MGYLTGRKQPEANGVAHAEGGSAAGLPAGGQDSAGIEAHPAADCTSQSLGFRLLEGQGFGQVAYPRWKAACLRERSTLGRHAHMLRLFTLQTRTCSDQESGSSENKRMLSIVQACTPKVGAPQLILVQSAAVLQTKACWLRVFHVCWRPCR